MATETRKHTVQLKDDVTSPGGTTIAGVYELENSEFRGILMNVVVVAAKHIVCDRIGVLDYKFGIMCTCAFGLKSVKVVRELIGMKSVKSGDE
nr:pyrroline-5-carboxylate reductase [Tanacetum cinerariifolium]